MIYNGTPIIKHIYFDGKKLWVSRLLYPLNSIDNLTSTIVAVKILRRLAPENQVGQLGSGETSWMVSLGL